MKKKEYYTPVAELITIKMERNIMSDYSTSSADMTIITDDNDWTY